MSKKINNEIRIKSLWGTDLEVVVDGDVIFTIPATEIIKAMDKQQLRDMIDEFVAEHLENEHDKLEQIYYNKFKFKF